MNRYCTILAFIFFISTSCFAQSNAGLGEAFKLAFKEYKVVVTYNDKRNEIGTQSVTITGKKSGRKLIAFDAVPFYKVDSAYIKQLKHFRMVQSCSYIYTRPILEANDFSYNGLYYFITPCSVCSEESALSTESNAIETDRCRIFKRKLINFLKDKGVKRETF